MKVRRLLIFSAVILSLVFRLLLTDKAWHVDMWPNAAWGEWIYTHGPAGFYTNRVWIYAWPTQPPLINSVYAFNKALHIELLGRLAFIEHQADKLLPGENIPWLTDFVQWFAFGNINLEIPFQVGFLVTMKLIPIFSDLLIAGLIVKITKKSGFGLLYLISPFSWYLSALWGQYDQTAVLFAILAFWLVQKGLRIPAPAVLVISFLIKPTTLILIPYFAVYFFRKAKRRWIETMLASVLAISVFWIVTAPYTRKNPFEFAGTDLIRIIFKKSEPRVSVNSFNLWRIFVGNKAVNSTGKAVGFSWSMWGIFAFAIINFMAVRLLERKGEDQVWIGVFLVSAGGFLFMTGMLERYMFAGVLSGLIVSGLRPKIVPYWLMMSVIFALNMYYQWWIPENWTWLRFALTWKADLLTRILSGINVLMFVLAAASLIRLPKPKPGNSQKLPDHQAGKQTKQV